MPQKIDVLFPIVPPEPNAIGDHTVLLSQALARKAEVRILTAALSPLPVEGVAVETAFSLRTPKGVLEVMAAIEAGQPDWLLLQYNAFSYGRWGWNPHVAALLKTVRERVPGLRCAVMAHETFPPPLTMRLRLMRLWQKRQLRQVGQAADLMLFSIEPWVRKFAHWFPKTPVRHLPVGSNMPLYHGSREEARASLNLPPDALIVGVFGKVHHSRLLNFVSAAAKALLNDGAELLVLYIGPDGEAVRSLLTGVPFRDAGRLPAPEVSMHLKALDIYLSPFAKGVSTRRGSFMAAIQHGCPTVTTIGVHTDRLLASLDQEAMLLASDEDLDAFVALVLQLYREPATRARLGNAAAAFYAAHFDWPVLAERLLAFLMSNVSVQTD